MKSNSTIFEKYCSLNSCHIGLNKLLLTQADMYLLLSAAFLVNIRNLGGTDGLEDIIKDN